MRTVEQSANIQEKITNENSTRIWYYYYLSISFVSFFQQILMYALLHKG